MGSLFARGCGAGDRRLGDWTEGEVWMGVSIAFTFFSGGCDDLVGLPGPRLVPVDGECACVCAITVTVPLSLSGHRTCDIC